MAKVQVREAHQKPADDVKAGIAELETMMSKYMVSIDWNGHNATLSGPVNGEIKITDHDIYVEIKLGMMAKMAGIDAKRLEGSIRKRLRNALDA